MLKKFYTYRVMKKIFKALDISHMVIPKARNTVFLVIKKWNERRRHSLETVCGSS